MDDINIDENILENAQIFQPETENKNIYLLVVIKFYWWICETCDAIDMSSIIITNDNVVKH